MGEILLETRKISKHFLGVRALEDVPFVLKSGSIHAICGENGAGKSTLVKILMGIIQRDGGEIYLRGKPVRFAMPRQAISAGISIIEQELSPVPGMTIAENIFLGREGHGINPFIDYRRLNRKAKEYLDLLGIDLDPKTKMKTLKVAHIQLVEIAKALSYDFDVLIMDEPTSAIGEKEVDQLFGVLRKLKERGKGIIYITHRIKEIFQIADEVTVLRDGQAVGGGQITDFNRDKLISLMIGRKLETEFVKENIPREEPLLTVSGFGKRGEFHDIGFTVRRGEILGIFGLMGSGRTEFFNALFGVTRPDHGHVNFNGKPIRVRKPAQSLRLGIAYVTEDRKESGLVLQSSVSHNISLASLKRFSIFSFIREKLELSKVKNMINSLDIRTPSPKQLAKRLSGGNQQKVVLGRWMLTEPILLLLDEPTRGIDVGAKREIYRFISDFAAKGNAVVMISSELPEIIGMSDRIAVFRDGRISEIVDRTQLSQERLMQLAT